MTEAIAIKKPRPEWTDRDTLRRNLLLAQAQAGQPVALGELMKYFLVVKLIKGVSFSDL